MAEVIYLVKERRILKARDVPLLMTSSPTRFGLGKGSTIDISIRTKNDIEIEVEDDKSKVRVIKEGEEKEILVGERMYYPYFSSYYIKFSNGVITILF